MLAKLNVQATDAAYLEIVEHLAKVNAHFTLMQIAVLNASPRYRIASLFVNTFNNVTVQACRKDVLCHS